MVWRDSKWVFVMQYRGPDLGTLFHLLVKLQRHLAIFFLLLIAIIFGLVVVLRQVLDVSFFAYEEWVLIAGFGLYALGGALGSFERTHIRADMLEGWIKNPSLKRIHLLVIIGLEAVVAMVLTYWAALMVLLDFARFPNVPSTPVYSVPLLVPKIFIFVGFFLMALYSSVRWVQLLRSNGSTTA